jgi:hypothetical protein
MALEIRELVIRATVGEEAKPGQSPSQPGIPADQEAIVAACVEKVLQILKDKNER